MQYQEVLEKLNNLKNPEFAKGMARFGIRPKTTVYGISAPILRNIAKNIGKDHKLALRLFDSNIHEARILAGFIEAPEKVTKSQFAKWVNSFDSWDVCDQICGSVFWKVIFINKKIFELSRKKPEFVKRTAFALMACLAARDKDANDKDFLAFFPLIKKESVDERNFVKKAVNWALRQIGKRNKNLHKKAAQLAQEILRIDASSAKWIAKNTIKELEKSHRLR